MFQSLRKLSKTVAAGQPVKFKQLYKTLTLQFIYSISLVAAFAGMRASDYSHGSISVDPPSGCLP